MDVSRQTARCHYALGWCGCQHRKLSANIVRQIHIYIYIEIHKHVREDDNITEGKGEIQKKKWPINSHREHNALCNYRMGPEDTNIRIRERARARVSHRVFRTTGTIHSV